MKLRVSRVSRRLPAAMREGQEKMQKDLDEIKELLQQGARPAAPSGRAQAFGPTDIQLGDVPSKGEPDAPVIRMEFNDYHCPLCKRHATTVMPELIKSYVDTGNVRFVMREYPIPRLHPRASAGNWCSSGPPDAEQVRPGAAGAADAWRGLRRPAALRLAGPCRSDCRSGFSRERTAPITGSGVGVSCLL